jgi:hypothetical protein
VSSTSFVVRGSATCAEGWAAVRLPFEPEGSTLEYRQALRRVIAGLDPARGGVLRGKYASRDTGRCEVENLLLYNVGLSAFGHLRPHDVVLSRSFTPPAPPECQPSRNSLAEPFSRHVIP